MHSWFPACKESILLPPQSFKSRRVRGRVSDGVLNVPVSQIVLNQPRVCALVGEGKAACMAEHMRMRLDGQACALPIGANHQPGGFTAERAALRLFFAAFMSLSISAETRRLRSCIILSNVWVASEAGNPRHC